MFRSLWLKDFRNFDEALVQFSSGVNIFLGANGQGKTNLLEALYLLCRGDSFRYSENVNLIRSGQSQALLKAKIDNKDLHFDLSTQILKSKKNHLLNGKRISFSELSRRFPVIIFSPESLSAIKEGADQRRLLVDDLLISVNPNNADVISDYRKALRTRNKLLKNLLEGVLDRHQTISVLESLNPIFLDLAFKLTSARVEALRSLGPDFSNIMAEISNSPTVDISVEYVSSSQNILDWAAEDIRQLLVRRHSELRDAELSSGSSLVGPHKQDINFLYNGNNSRFFCSQGQQRALILSFKMAQIVYHRRVHGTYPVLLLDDVMSELDVEKRGALLSFLQKIDSQIFLTTTDLSLPKDSFLSESSVKIVNEGRIQEGQ